MTTVVFKCFFVVVIVVATWTLAQMCGGFRITLSLYFFSAFIVDLHFKANRLLFSAWVCQLPVCVATRVALDVAAQCRPA